MKLNKVMALALSGLMAVSMLAGCSNGTPNGEENNEGQVTTTNAAEVMNSLQSKVEFKADSAMDAAFAAAMDGLESKDISDAPATLQSVPSNKAVYTAVRNKLPGSYALNTTINYATRPTNKADVTTTVLYWVKAANLSEESVLTLVADTMEMGNYYDQGYTGSNPYTYYELNYDGAVSIEKVTKTSESGTTYNAYVVAVSITRSYGDQVKA